MNKYLEESTKHLAQAIERIPSLLQESFPQAIGLIKNTNGHLICCGMGKSGLIAQKLASTFSSTGTPSFFLHPAEALHGDLGMITEQDSLLIISNSGETRELIAIIPALKRSGNTAIAMTGIPTSTLGKFATVCLNTSINRELCPHNLAPTTSTLVTLAIGDLMSVRLMHENGFGEKDFAKFHPGGSLGKKLLMKVKDAMHKPRSLPIVSQDTLLKQVIITMSEGKKGLALVSDKKKLLGIFTDGDLRRSLLQSTNAMDRPCTDFMKKAPLTIHQHASLMEAEQLLLEHEIKSLVVVEKPLKKGEDIYMESLLGIYERVSD